MVAELGQNKTQDSKTNLQSTQTVKTLICHGIIIIIIIMMHPTHSTHAIAECPTSCAHNISSCGRNVQLCTAISQMTEHENKP